MSVFSSLKQREIPLFADSFLADFVKMRCRLTDYLMSRFRDSNLLSFAGHLIVGDEITATRNLPRS
jgi:hypothetical protein